MLFFYLLLLALSAFVLLRAGGKLVSSLIGISHHLSLSEYATSFIIMSFATTLPELLVGINSALTGVPQLSLGNVFGANIANLGLILGLSALLSGHIRLTPHSTNGFNPWLNIILASFPVFLLIDGSLSRPDGVILLLLFFGYILKLAGRSRLPASHPRIHLPKPLPVFSRLKNIIFHFRVFFLAAVALLLAAYFIVFSAQQVSSLLFVPPFVIGFLLLAFSTTLPELSFSIHAAFSRHPELSLGDLIGATIFNSTLILGAVSVISPFSLAVSDYASYLIVAAFMVAVLIFANLALLTGRRLSRLEGVFLVILFLFFLLLSLSVL